MPQSPLSTLFSHCPLGEAILVHSLTPLLFNVHQEGQALRLPCGNLQTGEVQQWELG